MVESNSGIIKSGYDYYCAGENLLRDFENSAHRSADISGENQLIHMHKHGVECGEFEHRTVEPDPLRRRAVTEDSFSVFQSEIPEARKKAGLDVEPKPRPNPARAIQDTFFSNVKEGMGDG